MSLSEHSLNTGVIRKVSLCTRNALSCCVDSPSLGSPLPNVRPHNTHTLDRLVAMNIVRLREIVRQLSTHTNVVLYQHINTPHIDHVEWSEDRSKCGCAPQVVATGGAARLAAWGDGCGSSSYVGECCGFSVLRGCSGI